MTRKPNIIYLTIDAMRTDRTTIFGYERDTTPNLARIANAGISCNNCHSLAPVTQMSLVQLLTATRPLSYGGYDYGAIGRPANVFRVFKDAGYHTISLSTLHWVNSFFGYDDGVDDEHQLFGVITMPGVAFAMMRGTLRAYENGDITQEETYKHVEPVLRNMFTNLIKYFNKYEEQLPILQNYFADSAMMNSGYDHQKLLKITQRHEAELNATHFAYVEKYLLPAPQGMEWMQRWLPKDWYYARRKSKLASELMYRAGNKMLSLVNPDLAQAKSKRFKIYNDAASVIDNAIDVIRKAAQSDKPFFLWSHFLDTHLPYVSGRGRHWYKETPRYLRELGYNPDIPPAMTFKEAPENETEAQAFSALYDAALRSTDEQVGRIIDVISELGLEDNTIFAVAADHGEELGEFGHYGHFFRLNHYGTQVPCAISGPGVPNRKIDGLTSIMDIAPTLADLAGVAVPDDWDGASVLSPAIDKRDSLLIETFFAGNCLFEHRPIYFAVRGQDYFYIWREDIDVSDTNTSERFELYDLKADPEEKVNIYRPDHPALPRLEQVIAARMEEIPEITEARIRKAFPWYKREHAHEA